MGASFTHLLHFNDHGEDFLEQIITGNETWVHQSCPETKVQSMAWKHPGSPTLKKFKTSTGPGKLMVTVFWDMRGVLLLHFSPPNETVNSGAYQATLKKLKRAVQRKRPQMSDKRVLLLHDIARPHTAHATVNLSEQWGWEIFEHPTYSPDLATSDFHLFPNMKNIFVPSDSNHMMMSSMRCKRMCGQDPTFCRQGFEKWISRLDKCLNREGDYVEK